MACGLGRPGGRLHDKLLMMLEAGAQFAW